MIWLTIAAMALVTFVPRIIPFFVGRNLNLPPWIRRWLSFFPAAALGGLIFPGILLSGLVFVLWGMRREAQRLFELSAAHPIGER